MKSGVLGATVKDVSPEFASSVSLPVLRNMEAMSGSSTDDTPMLGIVDDDSTRICWPSAHSDEAKT